LTFHLIKINVVDQMTLVFGQLGQLNLFVMYCLVY